MKKIGFAVLYLAALVSVFSCTKDEGRVPDTGDLKMGIVMPGNESVTVCADLKSDSKATRVEITWGDTGSVSFDLTDGDSFQKKVAVPEGSYIFRVTAWNAGGKKVIDFPMAGRSYGANYISNLKSRVPVKFELSDSGDMEISWAANPTGCLGSVVRYLKTGVEDPLEVEVASDDTTTILEDFDGDEFSVSSLYYPEMNLYDPERRPVSVPDGFVYEGIPSAFVVYSNSGPVDVTSRYLKNAGPDMEGKERGGENNKWGLPVDWNVTDNVRNQAGNTLGGWKWENDNVKGVVHFESQDWDGPGFENGKVWQTVELPAGTYSFTANYRAGDGNAGMEMYVMAATGESLPDIGNRASALSFKEVPAGVAGEYTIIFTVPASGKVSLGLVVTVGGSNHWQQFSYFKMVAIPTTDVTSAYIKNAGPQIVGDKKDIKENWGVPVDWQYNAAATNQGGGQVGCWKSGNGGRIGFEPTDWSPTGGFENGKVWQSPTLPAGTYSLSIGFSGIMDENVVDLYLVVAEGAEIPDIEDLGDGSLAYLPLKNPGGERIIFFTLTEDTQVSMGVVITITGQSWVDAADWFKLINYKM